MTLSQLPSHTQDVAWLLWLDTLERLDTILLEIRHSQINLIHTLRTPELYQPLRYEEDYLWGSFSVGGTTKSWHILLAEPTQVRQIERWVAGWVVPYPTYGESRQKADKKDYAPMSEFCDGARHLEIANTLREQFAEKIHNGHWSADNRRLYHALSALQLLKANVLRDKLILCRWGIKALASRQDVHAAPLADRERVLGRFLLVRTAIMEQAHRHIQNLGDLKAQFDSALDLGIQDHPKPMTRRRREQGLYSAYLSDRCRQLGDMLQDYLLSGYPPSRQPPRFQGALYAHRWSHSATSSASVMKDGIGPQEWRPGGRDTDLINTSFWMPDRPDLQSVIAHEVAHNALQHAYGNLEPHFLRDAEGAFPRLLRLLSAVLDSFGMTRFPQGDTRYAHDHAITELACDLLAATVSGPAYLFALAQDIMGLDLDCLFRSPQHDIDFDLADAWLDDGWAALSLPGFEWHYRLRLVCVWTMALARHDPLCRTLAEGVEDLCRILLETVGDLGPKGVEPHVASWKLMTDTMANVARDSDALAEARLWRAKQRSNAAPSSTTSSDEGLQLLTPATRKALQDIIVKRKQDRLLKGQGDLERAFSQFYLGGKHTVGDLFLQLQDIPWQAALLRARDFLHHAPADDIPQGAIWKQGANGQWLTEMHVDGAPGRELYQIALEFAYWHHTSPCDPITAILRLWSNAADEFSPEKLAESTPGRTPEQYAADSKAFAQWSSPPPEERRQMTIEAMTRIMDAWDLGKAHEHKIEEEVAQLHPVHWVDAPYFAEGVLKARRTNPGQGRTRLTALQRLKLLQLRRLAIIYADHPLCRNVVTYLRSTADDPDADRNSAGTIEAALLTGFLHNQGMPKLLMLERTAATQLGACSRDLENGPFAQHNPSLHYHPLMGRYDLFGINAGEQLFRPTLPRFSKACRNKETLPPFFVRHELAILFQLGTPVAVEHLLEKHIPLAFLSVTLHSRSDRLDFLYRLKEHYIGEDGLDTADMVLLSEGWGDVIIALQLPRRTDGSYDLAAARTKLDRIFKLQGRLFSDFLVERTELILTFHCLGAVVALDRGNTDRNDLWPFSLVSRVRVNKHAFTGRGPDDANCQFTEGLKAILEQECASMRAFDVVRTPGRTDFSIYYRCRHLLADSATRRKVLEATSRNTDDVLTLVSAAEHMSKTAPKSFKCAETCKFRPTTTATPPLGTLDAPCDPV